MNHTIYKLSLALQRINKTLDSCCNGSLSFDDWYGIVQFYFDWQNTNMLIDEAERLIEENPGLLKELAATLKDESAKLIDNLEWY